MVFHKIQITLVQELHIARTKFGQLQNPPLKTHAKADRSSIPKFKLLCIHFLLCIPLEKSKAWGKKHILYQNDALAGLKVLFKFHACHCKNKESE